MKSIDFYCEKILKWFTKERILVIVVSLIFGMFLHSQAYTNSLLNPDGLWRPFQQFSQGWELSLGRWLLRFVDIIRFGNVNSTISSLFTILITAFCVIIIIDGFKIKNKIAIILTTAIFISSPYFSDTLTSPFCCDSYALAFLFALLSAYVVKKYNYSLKSILFGALFLSLSLGIYQAYINVAAVFSLMILVLEIVDKNNTNNARFSHFLKFLFMGILGIILYLILLKINLYIFDEVLSDYKNANSIGLNTLKYLPFTIINSYKSTFNYFFKNNIVNNFYYYRQYLNVLFFIVLLALLVITLKGKKIKSIILAIIYIGLMPLALGIIKIITINSEINLLMCAGMSLVFPFALALSSHADTNALSNLLNIFIYIITLIILYTYIVMTGQTYSAYEKTYDQAYSTAIRVVNKIENTEGYYDGIKILFAGGLNNQYINHDNVIYTMANGNYALYNVFFDSYGGYTYLWQVFIEKYIGVKVNICSDDEYKEIISTSEFDEMDTFPNQNSIKIIDGIMVVKMVNNPPSP